ncbi:MAG TPA: HtaA domain-containing protein [Solirubrobacterales bacterium]|jgi:hypothetical protein|nr:HtaA domain-containing protein [Solirubrobacterales bacterium]
MSKHPSRPPRRRWAVAALAALGLAAALPTAAAATPATGSVDLTLKPNGAGSLLSQKVQVRYSAKTGKSGATKRALRAKQGKKGSAKRVSLPVDDLVLGESSTASTSGGLLFSLQGSKARVHSLTVKFGPNAIAVHGTIGGKRILVFRAESKAQRSASSLQLDDAELILTGNGAEALGDRLGLETLAAGPQGSLAAKAAVTQSEKKEATPAPKPGILIDAPVYPVDPYAATCNVPAGKAGSVPGKVAGIAADPSFDVDQDATGTTIEWGFKQDFRDYVLNFAPGGSLPALEGATAHPAGATMASPGSFFEFALADGTYEGGSQPNGVDDKLVADGTGAMLFCKPGHGFDIVFKNPTVTIDGANSRVTADVGVNDNGTWHEFQRADIAELDLTGITPQVSDSGRAITWVNVPATLTADGALASSLPYPAGEQLDPITVRTTVNRPLLAECGIDAGTATPGPVTLTQAALPTLTSPVIGTGGTINWGFRRSTRATGVSGGHLDLLGGATEGYPGNMGGTNNPPPAGGQGKFFRFPIARYAYDAGTASATDDRLIATSNATVGFCNVNQGAFGVVISKPTLIVNGASSRIVANAYGYRGGFGWTGGRVDLVNLDASAVNVVATPTTVSWGEITADNTPLTTAIPVSGALLTEALSPSTLTMASTPTGWDPVAAQIVLP